MNEETGNADRNIDKTLKTLLRGLTQNNIKEIFAGHKALYQIGKSAIPHIRNAISQSNWSQIKRANEVRYLTGLVSILHDIDEDESNQIAKQLKRDGCDASIVHILNSICSFTINDYFQYEIQGISIFEHKQLVIKQPVFRKLHQWLKNVPTEDLDGIERVYILRRGDLQAMGNYTPILFNINLVWDNPCSRFNPNSFLNHFLIEDTLYHEIGHHIHRHTFGQDERQEREASDYARYILTRSNHLIFKIMRAICGTRTSPYKKNKAGD
jgi:hypothetical protein